MSDARKAVVATISSDSVFKDQVAAIDADLDAVSKKCRDSRPGRDRRYGTCVGYCHDFFLLRIGFAARDSSKTCSGLLDPTLFIAVRVASPNTAPASARDKNQSCLN